MSAPTDEPTEEEKQPVAEPIDPSPINNKQDDVIDDDVPKENEQQQNEEDQQDEEEEEEEEVKNNDDNNLNDNDEKEEKKENDDIDLIELDKILLTETVGQNTNNLSWDEIEFDNDDEKNGAKNLQIELEKKKLTNLPPFEMARFYIGSKYRIQKASKKWFDTMAIYKTHKLQTITEQQMIKCYKEMNKCIAFGGTDDEGRAIFAMKYSLWLPSNYENTDVIMKCFLMILNHLTENLQFARKGVVFIADCKAMGWANFNVDMEKIFTKLMQDAYPLRVAAMYCCDAPFLLNILLKICKPFLSKKMQERIHIISSDEMFKKIKKEQIPLLVGGTYDDKKLNPFYQGSIRYMRRCNIDHFAPI